MRRATACLLLLILALAAGCGSSDDAKRDAAAAARARARAALTARRVALGRRVFAANCASCHTMEGKVAHPTFIESMIPNLDEVRPRVAYAKVRAENGGFDMASFSGELSQARLLAVATYVATIGGRNVVDTSREEPGAVTLGQQVFRSHCERCHAIDGRKASGTPGYPGTDFNHVKPSQQMVIKQVLRGIPEEMPSFRGKLTSAQLHALAVYVTATAGE